MRPDKGRLTIRLQLLPRLLGHSDRLYYVERALVRTSDSTEHSVAVRAAIHVLHEFRELPFTLFQ
jgi:hypothetical protein